MTPRNLLFVSLLVLAAAFLILTAGWGDLYNETDGQYGGAAKVMAAGGSWGVPENNGIPRLVKPPLLYWGMAAAMKTLGTTAFAARLPSAIALVAWVAVTFLIGERMAGPWRGFVAGLILLSSLGTFTLGRIVMPEPLFSALIAGSLYCTMRGADTPDHRRRWFAGFWICAALASFSKGWHGLVYSLAIVALAALLCRSARPALRGLLSWQGPAIFAAINLPWYFYVESRFPGFAHNLFFTEHWGHVTGSDAPATNYTNVPRLQFLLLHAAWFFPWSVAAGFALWEKRRETAVKLRALTWPAALTAAWMAVIGGSVLLAGERQDYYAMALWPAFALATAWLIERTSLRPAALAISALLALAWIAAAALPEIIPLHETAALADRATAWTTVTNFDRSVWSGLQTTAYLALGGGLFFALAAAAAKGHRQGVLALAATGLCLGLGALSGTSIVSPYFSLAKAANAIPSGASIIYDGGIDTGSSLLFYTDAPVLLLNQNADEDFIVRKFGIGRDRYISTSQLIQQWQNPEAAVVFVTEQRSLPHWEAVLGPLPPPIARCGTQVLLRK